MLIMSSNIQFSTRKCGPAGHLSFQLRLDTYLLFLLVEVVNDDTDEEVEGEEAAEDDEEDKVDVHVDVDLADGLLPNLRRTCVWFFQYCSRCSQNV